jgi:hypothetical protein
MSEETVERLDFDVPPPGYHCAGRWWIVDVPEGTPIADEDHGCADGPARSCLEREALGIAAAWAHYKRRHDPPGNIGRIMFDLGVADWGVPAARWAWYERRLALESSDGAPVPAAPVWPRCLSWSDDQIAVVERWLAEGGPLPKLLRERRFEDGSTELVELDGTEYVVVDRIDIRRADYDWARAAGVPPLEALAWAYGPRPLPAARVALRPIITLEHAANDPAELERKLIEWQRSGAPLLLALGDRVEVHRA